MKVIDKNGNEVYPLDFALGYYIEDSILIAHHDAQEYIPEVYHYETVHEYPNGGKDVIKVVDIPGQEAREAWDEYEDILRWHWYADDDPRPPVSMIAQSTIAKDTYFMLENVLYYAISAIPFGSLIIPNTNCIKVNVANALNELSAQT